MSLTSSHAHVAALARHRAPDDPDLIAARDRLRDEKLISAISRALKKSPPLTDALRERIVGLVFADVIGGDE